MSINPTYDKLRSVPHLQDVEVLDKPIKQVVECGINLNGVTKILGKPLLASAV